MKALAPGRLSTITGVLLSAVMALARARASWSVALPAVKGTTKVMALSGKPWASTGPPRVTMAAASADCSRVRRGMLMKGLLVVVGGGGVRPWGPAPAGSAAGPTG